MRSTKIRARRASILVLMMTWAIAAVAQDGSFIISSVDFLVQGRTLPFVLKQKLEAGGRVIGKGFKDEAALDAFIEEKRHILSNNRVLASVEASREISPNPLGGGDVRLTFTVVDTWNLVALPKPDLNSNDGIKLSIKAKDYNFVGSMQPLSLDLSYVSDVGGNTAFQAATSFSLPFQAIGADWSFGVSEEFQAWSNDTRASNSTAGLTLNIPGLGFPANAQVIQGLYFNDDQPVALELDPWYLNEYLGINASIPLDPGADVMGQVFYEPTLSVSQNWWPGTVLGLYGRQGLSVKAANTLRTGRADWVGNMKKGGIATLSGDLSYNFFYHDLILDLRGSLEGYANSGARVGIAGRLSGLARAMGNFPDDLIRDLGAEMRGIVDSRVTGVAGVYANLALPIKLFDFPTRILIKKDWFDFELQAQPFVDAGLVLPSWSAKPSSDWLWASGGIEFLVFPLVMRSFIVRGSIGWDIESVISNKSLSMRSPRDGGSPFEFSFGTGLYY